MEAVFRTVKSISVALEINQITVDDNTLLFEN